MSSARSMSPRRSSERKGTGRLLRTALEDASHDETTTTSEEVSDRFTTMQLRSMLSEAIACARAAQTALRESCSALESDQQIHTALILRNLAVLRMPIPNVSGLAASVDEASIVTRDRSSSSEEPLDLKAVVKSRRQPSPRTSGASVKEISRTVVLRHDRVKLLSMLGRGGSGSVYSAICDSMVFACKVVATDGMSRPDVERILNEATLVEQFSHPNLIDYFGHEVIPHEVWIYMEKFNCTLRAHLTERSMTLAYISAQQVAAYALQIASAMAYLHSLMPIIMHRDIKSENCFCRLSARPGDSIPLLKLGDFGEARALISRGQSRLEGNVGTTEFMAPEMVVSGTRHEAHYNEKVDVWSFGMLLFELMCLELPYRCSGLKQFEIPDLVARGVRPIFPRSMPARAVLERSEVFQVFMGCTEFDPVRRLTAARIVKTLTRLRGAP